MLDALTDEQVWAYFDAAHDRLAAAINREFVEAAEAVRIGTLAAHDRQAANRWSTLRRTLTQAAAVATGAPARGAGLTGADLERAVSAMLITNPDIVTVQVAHG